MQIGLSVQNQKHNGKQCYEPSHLVLQFAQVSALSAGLKDECSTVINYIDWTLVKTYKKIWHIIQRKGRSVMYGQVNITLNLMK